MSKVLQDKPKRKRRCDDVGDAGDSAYYFAYEAARALLCGDRRAKMWLTYALAELTLMEPEPVPRHPAPVSRAAYIPAWE